VKKIVLLKQNTIKKYMEKALSHQLTIFNHRPSTRAMPFSFMKAWSFEVSAIGLIIFFLDNRLLPFYRITTLE